MSRVLDVFPMWIGRVAVSTALPALTCDDAAAPPVLDRVRSVSMRALPSDYQLLWWVSRFKQLTTPQIAALAFPDVKSRTTYDRVIQKAIKCDQLERVPTANTTANVYQLGREGWGMFFTGRRKLRTTVDYHALAIADVLIAVMQASRDGKLEILDWQSEPDTHVEVAGADLRPDLYLCIDTKDGRKPLYLWLEVDLGGERQRQITEKLERYIYAQNNDDKYPGEIFPQILFLATKDERVRELKQIMKRTKDLPSGLAAAQLLPDFPLSILL